MPPDAAPTYGTINLSWIIPNQDNGYGTLNFALAVNGLQNRPNLRRPRHSICVRGDGLGCSVPS